jgi:hypothetical protein
LLGWLRNINQLGCLFRILQILVVLFHSW